MTVINSITNENHCCWYLLNKNESKQQSDKVHSRWAKKITTFGRIFCW